MASPAPGFELEQFGRSATIATIASMDTARTPRKRSLLAIMMVVSPYCAPPTHSLKHDEWPKLKRKALAGATENNPRS